MLPSSEKVVKDTEKETNTLNLDNIIRQVQDLGLSGPTAQQTDLMGSGALGPQQLPNKVGPIGDVTGKGASGVAHLAPKLVPPTSPSTLSTSCSIRSSGQVPIIHRKEMGKKRKGKSLVSKSAH